MAVIQPMKQKAQPVLDFQELNEYMMCHTGGNSIDVCGETLWKWRQMVQASMIGDLKFA